MGAFAYANDVALMIKGKFLSTVYELAQKYLSVLTNWPARSGLVINSNKTDMHLFTKRNKIPKAPLPWIGNNNIK